MQIRVSDAPYDARGDGTTDCTAALQAAINDAITRGTSVLIPSGVYILSDELLIHGINQPDIRGEGIYGTRLQYTGTKKIKAVVHCTSDYALMGGVIENLSICGNANSQYGLAFDGNYGTINSTVRRVGFAGMTDAGLMASNANGCVWEQVMVLAAAGNYALPLPEWGIIVDGGSGPDVIISPIIENTLKGGLWLKSGGFITVTGAQISTMPIPLQCDAIASSFHSCLFESGQSAVTGTGNKFNCCEISSALPDKAVPTLKVSGQDNSFYGGCIADTLEIASGANGNSFDRVANLAPSGVNDNSKWTRITRAWNG